MTAPSSIPGFDNGCLVARRGAGEGVSDSGKLAYLKNGNGAIDRSFAFPKRFPVNGCQRQFKAKWLDEYQWLTYSASEDGGFYHALCFTEVVVKMLGSWSRSPWPTGQELQQPRRSTLSAKRTERVLATPRTAAKGRPQRCPARSSTKRRRYLGKQAETLLDLGLCCQLRLEMMTWNWLCLKLCWRKELHDVKEMIRHGWTDGANLKRLTKIGQNLLILDTIWKIFFRGQAPGPPSVPS